MMADPAAWGYKRKHMPSGKLPEGGTISEWRRDPNETYSKGQVQKTADGYRTIVSAGEPFHHADTEWGKTGWGQVVMTRPATPEEVEAHEARKRIKDLRVELNGDFPSPGSRAELEALEAKYPILQR